MGSFIKELHDPLALAWRERGAGRPKNLPFGRLRHTPSKYLPISGGRCRPAWDGFYFGMMFSEVDVITSDTMIVQ